MKKQYKALMLDLDGTTIPNKRDGLPSQKVIQTIAKASKKIHVGVATSRPAHSAFHLIKLLQVSSPCIVDGGPFVIDPVDNKVLYERNLLAKDEHFIRTKVENLEYLYKINQSVYEHNVEKGESAKVSSIWIGNLTEKIADDLITSLSSIPTISLQKIVSWNKDHFDIKIMHAEATKQHGIWEVAKILDIDTHDIIGVGDGYNDFPLLMACGLKVAMGNAVPELKAIADYIAPTVEEDGVVDVIEKFILNKHVS